MRWTLALLLAVLPTAASAGERVQYALIVSNNRSNDPKVPPLRFADDDGARFYELLEPQSKDAALLTVLDGDTQARHPGLASKTRPPTERELFDAFERLDRQMAADRDAGRDPVLYFVFTGHGQRGEAGEGSISLLGKNFTRTQLYQQVLARTHARFVHLIVDACDSYFFVNSRGALPRAESYAGAVKRFLDERTLEQYPNVGVVLSTASAQESHEWSGIFGGVFSHQVLSALSGAADVNADGRVEYSELRAFIAAANARVEDPRARPEVFARPPAQDHTYPLVDLTRPSRLGFVTLPAGMGGHFVVEDERGVRLVELHKEKDRATVLALPTGRELFLRSTTREAAVRLEHGTKLIDGATLLWRERTVASRGSLEETFRDDLFSIPYGPRFYEGFVTSTGERPVAPAAAPRLEP
ncbi:MAG: hypothetical protein IRZ16_05465 [Myxococcaceae bacterium]|nr:hypothetical protein [Myxococcaceae bacterium]